MMLKILTSPDSCEQRGASLSVLEGNYLDYVLCCWSQA